MASESSILSVQKMFVAYYGRPGDPAGVDYWATALDDSEATGGSLDEIINAFGNSQEFLNGIGSESNTTADQVTILYQQMFNRDPEPGGLAFWVNAIDTGVYTLAQSALAIANGAQNDDITILTNKISAANYYTEQVVVTGATYEAGDIAAAQAIIATVDETEKSVTDSKALTDAALIDQGGSGGGDTFTLTTGLDTIVGTAGDDDIFGFVNANAAAGSTLNSGDTISGGEGEDTLFVTIESASDSELNLNMTGVEKIEVRDSDTQNFYVQNVTGLDTISLVAGEGKAGFFNGTYVIPNIEFHNVDRGIGQFPGMVDVIDNLNVLVDNADAGLRIESDNMGEANYMVANISSVGAGYNDGQNYLFLSDSRGAHTVNVSGTTDLELYIDLFRTISGGAEGSVDTIDASALEAGLEIQLRFKGYDGDVKTFIGGTGDDDVYALNIANGLEVSISTGTGSDMIDLGQANSTSAFTVDAGADDDLIIGAAGDDIIIGGL